MPKMKPLAGRCHLNGEDFYHSYECHVSASGDFYISIPDDQLALMKVCLAPNVRIDRSRNGVWQAWAATLAALQATVNEFAMAMLKADVTEEHRIYYRAEMNAQFWKLTDGAIQPNGYALDTGYPMPDGSGQWAKMPMMTNERTNLAYSVGLGARVLTRKTLTLRTGRTKIDFARYQSDRNDSYADKLNRFCHINIWPGARHGYEKDENHTIPWLPYTEENAKFFYDAMIAVCTMADRFQTFFGTGAADLLESMASRQTFLAAPRKDPQ